MDTCYYIEPLDVDDTVFDRIKTAIDAHWNPQVTNGNVGWEQRKFWFLTKANYCGFRADLTAITHQFPWRAFPTL
jgi:hypothetical protein